MHDLSSPDSQQRIMAVDDEDEIVALVKMCLGRQGYYVSCFTDPIEALRHFEREGGNYGLVISDIRMPTMNGYHLVRKIRDMRPGIKVILMSSFEINPNEFSKVLPSVKIDGFISKPASLNQIINTVKTHMPYI
jgi:two-component system, cell cycle response regulator CpdR